MCEGGVRVCLVKLHTRCSMECRSQLRSVLHANAMRPVLAPHTHGRGGGSGGIRFASGQASDDEEECIPLSWRWYRAAYARLLRLSGSLWDVEHADGRLLHAVTGSPVTNARVIARMAQFEALAGKFVADQPPLKGMVLSSLTRVCDVLCVSAQRRKTVRLTICPQVTQHHIWRGTLEELLKDMQTDISSLERRSPATQMAEQIASACTRFLSNTADAATSMSPSWMRPTPFKKPAEAPPPAKTWQEVLDMFTDLAKTLETEPRLTGHAEKIEVMKEGLYQIRDIVIERDISFKEARRQDCLVQRKLSKSLGHSSRCLFTLLLFYLYGTVHDLAVHIGKCVSGKGDKNITVHATKFLTSSDESAVRSGLRQLSHALGVFRFVWEAANADDNGTGSGNSKGMEGTLELKGHLWGFGVEKKTLTYRGNEFHVHKIRLR